MLTDAVETLAMTRIETAVHPIAGSARMLKIVTVTGGEPGPTLAVIGAVHGNELEGPLAISQILANLESEPLAGRLLLLPVANPDAVAAGQRCTPSDGMNLARIFPGRADGSVTEALAALITRQIIAPADALIDMHSAAVNSESPLLVGYSATPGPTGARAAAMARAFGAPVVWRHAAPCAPGRTISEAEARGIPAIYTEATGGLFPPEDVVDVYAEGVLRVMQHLGMIASVLPDAEPALHLTGAGNTDLPTVSAPVAGLLHCHIQLGCEVAPAQHCFTISDVDGTVLAEIHAPGIGHPVFLRRARWVEAGELLMFLAVIDEAGAP